MKEPATALNYRKAFVEGRVSATEQMEALHQHIDQEDPQVRAFLTLLKERTMKRAEELDKKRKEGKPLGKLAGVPVAIKDNIHIAGERTTCGSHFLEGYSAPFDATVVRLLEEEDALLVGKTNLDEFAMGSTTEHSAFFSTHNPWDLTRTAGGSSGGSSAAVSAGFAPIALGTDTGGSIRQPAALCGVVGFKPTYGRVSRYGLVAFASSLDQIGPLTPTVADAALCSEVLGQHCPFDATSLPIPSEPYLQQALAPISSLTIGVPTAFLEGANDAVQEDFARALQRFEGLGAKVIEVQLKTLKHSIPIYYILATAEASTNLARFDGVRFSRRSSRGNSLTELYEYSKEEGYGAEVKRRVLLGTYVLSAGFKDAFYGKAQQVRSLMIQDFRRAFQECDLIALPTTPTPAKKLKSFSSPLEEYLSDLFTISANVAGLPAISIPSGLSPEGLPLGIQLLGPQREDGMVLQAAHAFEQAAEPFPLSAIASKGLFL